MKLPKGFCLFSGGAGHLEAAKEYIRKNFFTHEDVRILSNENEVLVISKKEVELTD